ncbi:GNAT family N-acetyltransferase [Lentzea sp. NPDC004789]
MTNWIVTAGVWAADSPLNHDYYVDIIGRYWGKDDVAAEVEQYQREEEDSDVPVFLVASRDGEDAGCLGMRFLGAGVGELTRMFVRERFRGQGAASALLTAMEAEALARGVTTLRLDVRSDLVEARNLYAKHGFVEIENYNDAKYAGHWFEKRLTSVHLDAIS